MSTGNDFTSYEIINTYKTLLYASSVTPSSAIVNEGFTTDLKDIRSGDGTISPLQISSDFVNINGSSKLKLDGTILTATASALNALTSAPGTLTKITTGDNTLLFTEAGVSVSTASTSLTAVVNPTLNLLGLTATQGSFSAVSSTNLVAATGSFTTKVSGVAAEFSANVSVANLFASTNIFIGGAAIPNTAALTSISNVVAAVSVLTSINTVAITAITTIVGVVSALTSVNKAAITSINSIIGDGTGFVTDSELATVSAALAASIGNSNTNITANATAITSINSNITAVSAALATSIATRLPLAGGTLTGIVSGTDLVLSGGIGLGTVTALLGKKARMIAGAAIADLVTLTDGSNIAVNLNTGQNFTVTLADNRTLDNPTNCVAGQVGSIFITQDGTGSRTLAFGSSWDFPGGTAPVLTTDAAGIDRLDYIVQTSTDVQALLTKAYS